MRDHANVRFYLMLVALMSAMIVALPIIGYTLSMIAGYVIGPYGQGGVIDPDDQYYQIALKAAWDWRTVVGFCVLGMFFVIFIAVIVGYNPRKKQQEPPY